MRLIAKLQYCSRMVLTPDPTCHARRLILRNCPEATCFAKVGGQTMTRIDRRRLLKFAGAATLAASTGGIAGILASARAPAYGQMTSLQWLKFVDFVPVSDQLLRGKIT